MLDADIRPVLRQMIATLLCDAVVFEEFPVCRKGRADIAAVNGSLWGYEIKSARDTLARLPLQIGHYDRIFDFNVACVAKAHMADVRQMVPKHWGLVEVSDDLNLVTRRSPKANSSTSPAAQLRLLWRNEVAQLLRQSGIAIPPRALAIELWQLAEGVPVGRLRDLVRQQLKARARSESGEQRKPDGDLATTEPSLSSYPAQQRVPQPH